jgi:hypothetical protein
MTPPAPRHFTLSVADVEEFGRNLAEIMRPSFDKLQRRVDDVEAELASLRRTLSTVSAVRRRFVDLTPDADHPGCSLLWLDDGSAVSMADERRTSLAGSRTIGSA